MPYKVNLESDEKPICDYSITIGKKGHPFLFVVTTHAIFIPRKKSFAVSDATYFERVPLRKIQEVRIQRLRPYAMLVLAALMVIVGSIATYFMMVPQFKLQGGQVSGYPPAIVVVGLVIPFVIRGRYGLVVSYGDKRFQWKPTIALDKKSRTEIANFLTKIANACRTARCNVIDERSAK
jgi:hypothetical protein